MDKLKWNHLLPNEYEHFTKVSNTMQWVMLKFVLLLTFPAGVGVGKAFNSKLKTIKNNTIKFNSKAVHDCSQYSKNL